MYKGLGSLTYHFYPANIEKFILQKAYNKFNGNKI